MASGQVSGHNNYLRHKRKYKSVQVATPQYDVLKAKALEETCPMSTIIERLIDLYITDIKIWGAHR